MITLVCLHCNHSNLGDAKFCIECGAELLRRLCPHCHTANGIGAQFCQDCGARLPAEAEIPEAALLHRPAPPGPVPVLSQAVEDAPAGAGWRRQPVHAPGAAAHMRATPDPRPATESAAPAAVLSHLSAVLQPWPTRAISAVGAVDSSDSSDSQLALSGSRLMPHVGEVDEQEGSWLGRLHPFRTTIGIGLIVAVGIATWVFRGPASTSDEPPSGGFSERAAQPSGTAVEGPGAQAANASLAPSPAVAATTPTAAMATAPVATTTAAVAAAPQPAAAAPSPDALPAPAAQVLKAPEPAKPQAASPAQRVAVHTPPRLQVQQARRERVVEVERPAPAPAPAASPAPRPVAVCSERIQALGLCTFKP